WHAHAERLAGAHAAALWKRIEPEVDAAEDLEVLTMRRATEQDDALGRDTAAAAQAAQEILRGASVVEGPSLDEEPGVAGSLEDAAPQTDRPIADLLDAVHAAESEGRSAQCRQWRDRWQIVRRLVADRARQVDDLLGIERALVRR